MKQAAAVLLLLGGLSGAAGGQTLDDPDGAGTQHGFRPFAQRYHILPDHNERKELTFESLDSGTLRIESEAGEPLPPVVVDSVETPPRITPWEPPAAPVQMASASPGPEEVRRLPKARLTGLRVSETRQPASKNGSLKDLTISFTGLDQQSRPVKFRYKMDGLNPDWIETDQPKAFYSSLKPGEYRFEVQAINDAGLSSPSAALPFTISATPWWRRSPELALSLAVLALASTGSLYSSVRARQLLQMERLRASIASSLHDRIGAGLTDIAILSEVAARKSGGLPELARVSDTARELVDGLGDIVWLVNPRRDSLYELFVRLKDAYAELFEASGAQLEVGDLSPFEGARLPIAYRQDLHLLFQEALRNALRHSGCRHARLTVSLTGRHLRVDLRDDGHGFDPTRPEAGQGLETMHHRAQAIGGHLAVETSAQGTAVRFEGKIPRRWAG